MKKLKNKKIVFVGMSGGVDSSVSVAILKEQGYDVVGVFIRTWHPDFLPCNEEKERLDAMRVAAFLNIPFLTFDFEDIYKKGVADYMIAEYKAGRTPNPDVMCNKEVKFGAFLKKSLSMGADYVATGHYAISKKYSNDFNLLKGKDSTKDQVYFLWTLKQEQLSKIFFPVGNIKKTEVRKLAKKFKLPVADKKDSQGICFLGAVDLKEFLKHYIKEKGGNVVNTNGEIIGYHDGAVFHTLGERHGFTITKKNPNDGAYYIVSKNIKKNTLVVSQDKNSFQEDKDKKNNSEFYLEIDNLNWINEIPKANKNYQAQIRYHGEFLPCKIELNSKTKAKVIFKKYILADKGQSCVIYDKDVCLGGGIII
ncbi:MAG TPA: tRNA 2-thiouridine(34) synthase MnmA [Candidatus Paceibacterota bacterium]|nr:tRNA 2-thiouridine(34) synthase MnmA [Candidatus Paceibacterota bacterium]HPT18172.1 tRNA 2-thiouridine(34) synthase MnmA [Candidatus Paceibacterota bacterium]